MTLDLDFSDIRAYPPGDSAGRIVLRLESQDKRRILSLIEKLCLTLVTEDPRRRLWIVERDKVRIRE